MLDDPQAQDLYRQFMALDVELGWNIAGARAISMLQLPTSSAPSTMPEPPAPPVLGFLGSAAHGAVGYFAAGWPLAYLIATVIFGIGLVVGTVVHVSEPVPIVRQSVPLPSPLFPVPSVVGRITAMADCRFEERSGFGVQGQGLKIKNRKSEIRNPSSPSATSSL